MRPQLRKVLQNCAILLLIISSLFSIVAPYIHSLGLTRLTHLHLSLLSDYAVILDVDVSRVLSFTLNVVVLLVAYSLYKRVRVAWIIMVMVQSALLMFYLLHLGQGYLVSAGVKVFILAVLFVTHKDFSRVSERASVWRALLFSLGALFLVLGNSILSLALFHSHFQGAGNFGQAVARSVNFLFTMTPSQSGYGGRVGLIFANSLIVINWIFIIGAVVYLLRPLIITPFITYYGLKEVQDLVAQYGENSLSHLALEADKSYFFGDAVRGVVAYRVRANVFVVCGDMLCAHEDRALFMGEILRYCRRNDWTLAFVSATEEMLALYKEFGFSYEKIGEEALIDLSGYSLKGKAIRRARTNINHATKLGITVSEYQPLVRRDGRTDRQLSELTEKWQKKKGSKLCFVVGTMGLQHPLGRRYFLAHAKDGGLLGLAVLLPYAKGTAYMLDILRPAPEAPFGTMEKLIVEAFMQLKAEGVQQANLGLCPLVNVTEDEKNTIMSYLLSLVYRTMKGTYNFHGLYQFKKKFAPTDWQPRYIAYYPRAFSPRLGLALVRAMGLKLREK